MKEPLVAKYAVRSLGRNVRRTLLSVLGVGVGCGVALFLTAFMAGSNEMRVRAVAESGVGHMRIAPPGWLESRDSNLRLEDWRSDLEIARSHPGVRVAAPHAETTALLAFGTRVVGVRMLGVDPAAEVKVNRLIRALETGRYLEPGDRGATVIGATIAERLDVELDDDLMATVVGADGEIEYAMLRIVGIVNTGSRDIDSSICHVTLEDLGRITGLEGAGEITVLLDDPGRMDRMVADLAAAIPRGDEVLTWMEVLPVMGGDMKSDQAFTNLFVGIVVIVVVLGITSAQMTAILERRREFAVLMALGARGVQVIRLLLIEAAAIGLLGAGAGLMLATPLVHRVATKGIDFAAIMGEELSMEGVLFEPVMYADMGLWMIPQALVIAMVSTLIAALYPAWFAIRTNPTSALSLREA